MVSLKDLKEAVENNVKCGMSRMEVLEILGDNFHVFSLEELNPLDYDRCYKALTENAIKEPMSSGKEGYEQLN